MKKEKKVKIGYCQCGCGQKTNWNRKHKRLSYYILGHNTKMLNWKGGRSVTYAGYVRIYQPENPKSSHGYVLEHILIAQKLVGINKEFEIHHYGQKSDNDKIVICENHAFHMLLHQRTRAYFACGHANWRKCTICKQYDDPQNMYISQPAHHQRHRGCFNEYHKKYKENKARVV